MPTVERKPVVRERSVRTNGVAPRVLDAGNASPVVLAHGFPERGAAEHFVGPMVHAPSLDFAGAVSPCPRHDV